VKLGFPPAALRCRARPRLGCVLRCRLT
jgi:hypothetical protein